MANLLENLSDIKDKAKQISDQVSTTVYKTGREAKEKIDNSFNGKSKADSESKQRAAYQQEMKNQFLNGQSDIQVDREYLIDGDGLVLDENRAEFNVIDENEYQEPIKVLTPVETIESFLCAHGDENTFFETQGAGKKEKDKQYNPEKISRGNALKNDFLNDKFAFQEKNALLKDQKVATSDASIERYGQLNHIINAYAGDKEELKIVGENTNSTVTNRFCEIINDYILGKSNVEKTGDNLYMEIHGIDHSKMPEYMSLEKIISLCALSELGQDAVMFAERTTNEIQGINDLIKNNSSINIAELILKNSIEHIFEKTRTEGDQIKDVENNLHGGAVDTLYFSNEGDGTVSVFHESVNSSKLVARQMSDGSYETPAMEKNLMNAMKSDKGARDEIEGRGKDGLDHEIESMRSITEREALRNPMSKSERAAYDKEVQDAENRHNRLTNQYANN